MKKLSTTLSLAALIAVIGAIDSPMYAAKAKLTPEQESAYKQAETDYKNAMKNYKEDEKNWKKDHKGQKWTGTPPVKPTKPVPGEAETGTGTGATTGTGAATGTAGAAAGETEACKKVCKHMRDAVRAIRRAEEQEKAMHAKK